jgi:leader peptidase (prepilin peptidase)/N-methyltransferase
MILLLLLLALLPMMAGNGEKILQNILGMLVISIPMLFMSVIRPGAFGGGDIKLMAVGGLYLGRDKIVLAAILAVAAAAVDCMFLLLCKKGSRKTSFPLGPFLCGGMICSLLIL